MRWAAMRFLIEAARRQRQRVRLEQWLLLLARCLIVALAALAIARPTMPGGDSLLGSRATTLYLLIDNSLTASSVSESSADSALASHQELAYNLLDRLDETRGDRACVIPLAGPASGSIAPASSDIINVGAMVRQLAPADSRADLHGALARVAAQISQDSAAGSRSVIAILSEFRAGSAAIERPLPTLAESPDIALAALPPAAVGLPNMAITGVDPLRPIVLGPGDASTTQVRIRAVRFGPAVSARAEVPVELLIEGGRVVARGDLVFEAGAREASVALGVDGAALGDLRRDGPGPIVVTARLVASDNLSRDDTRRAVIDRRESLLVGLVAPRRFGPRPGVSEYRAADWVQAALDPESLREGGELRVQGIDPGAVDASTLAGIEAVVVAEPQSVSADGWTALRRFADLGGLVVLFPQPGEGAQVWTDAAISTLGLPWELGREGELLSHRPAQTPGDAPDPGTSVGPGSMPDPPSAREPSRLTRPETPAPLLAMVEGELTDLLRPITLSRALPVTLRGSGSQVLLSLSDQRPIAVAAAPGSRATPPDEADPNSYEADSRGLVVYIGLAMDLGWSDLPTKPLLLPLLQEIVRQGVSDARGGWVVEAGVAPIAGAGAVELAWAGPGVAPAGAPRDIPLQPSGLARQAIRHAGVYRGIDASGAQRGLVIVNPASGASSTEPRSERDVFAWLAAAGAGRPLRLEGEPSLSAEQSADDAPARRDWSFLPLLFAAALALALVEAVAARFFSHALVAPTKEAA